MTSPFSNSTMGYIWMDNWCENCVNDINDDCPLILTAMMGDTPEEWVRQPDDAPDHNQYVCNRFEPKDE